MKLKYTISKASIEGDGEPEIMASFRNSIDRDDFFNLLEEKYPDMNWVKDGE